MSSPPTSKALSASALLTQLTLALSPSLAKSVADAVNPNFDLMKEESVAGTTSAAEDSEAGKQQDVLGPWSVNSIHNKIMVRKSATIQLQRE
jgi:hypothetical protein